MQPEKGLLTTLKSNRACSLTMSFSNINAFSLRYSGLVLTTGLPSVFFTPRRDSLFRSAAFSFFVKFEDG